MDSSELGPTIWTVAYMSIYVQMEGCKMNYGFGDWIVYDPGYKQEIGRVTECREHAAFVCYTQGCTAALTPFEHLRPATDDEIAKAPSGIGFHRFDATCSSRIDECCYMCNAKFEVEQ